MNQRLRRSLPSLLCTILLAVQGCQVFETPTKEYRPPSEAANIAVIPDGFTHVESAAFMGNMTLESVVMSDSITTIEGHAFQNCPKLTSITIPRRVSSIAADAFDRCTSLMKISVAPENRYFRSIDGVLYNKAGTKIIKFPAGKTGSFAIPDRVTSIGDFAFCDCAGITSLTIPDGVTEIGNYAFSHCTGLKAISIPQSVANIAMLAPQDYCGCGYPHCATARAFNGCDNLIAILVAADNSAYSSHDGVLYNKQGTSIVTYPKGRQGSFAIPNGVTSISTEAFASCHGLTGITLPPGIDYVGYHAFSYCRNLQSVSFPDTVSSFSAGAFSHCDKVKTITLPNNAKYRSWGIGGAFSGCDELETVTIPSKMTDGLANEFRNCPKLSAFIVAEDNLKYSSRDGLLCDKAGTKLICYPSGKSKTYTIPQGITAIGYSAFRSCASIEIIIIPDGVTSIEDAAFRDCSNLKQVAIPPSVTQIGAHAFYGCDSLRTVVIPPNVTSVGDHAFYLCANLENVTIPASVITIGEKAFSSCPNLKITIAPDNPKYTVVDGKLCEKKNATPTDH